MNFGHTTNHLFVPEPKEWGLRGDAFLWRELRARGRKVALPDTAEEVSGLLVFMIDGVLEQSWEGLARDDHVYHPSLAHGGMSSEYVQIGTWRQRLIPLLLARARARALHDYSFSRAAESS